MIKSEVLELRKRFAKEKATFDSLAGCYVDSSKNKVCKFQGSFLTLGEDVFFKYLDIAKKSLSGAMGNNLLEYEFPNEEEAVGGKQQALMALRDAPKSDALLDVYYDHIISTYETPDNYLILVFHDNYDVMAKSEAKQSQGESEEVFEYLLIAICPVSLDKPALHYSSDVQNIEPRERDWIVGAPETALLFPSFTDRSTDIHSCLVYSKNPKEQHKEFVENGLGCDVVKTTDEIREEFYNVIRSNFDDEAKGNKAVLSAVKDINDIMICNYNVNNRPSEITADDIKDMLSDDNRFSEAIVANIAEAYDKTFTEKLSANAIIDEGLLKRSEETLHILELEDSIVELNKMLKVSIPEGIVEVKAPDEVSDKICMKEIDGIKYIIIPADVIDIVVNGISVN